MKKSEYLERNLSNSGYAARVFNGELAELLIFAIMFISFILGSTLYYTAEHIPQSVLYFYVSTGGLGLSISSIFIVELLTRWIFKFSIFQKTLYQNGIITGVLTYMLILFFGFLLLNMGTVSFSIIQYNAKFPAYVYECLILTFSILYFLSLIVGSRIVKKIRIEVNDEKKIESLFQNIMSEKNLFFLLFGFSGIGRVLTQILGNDERIAYVIVVLGLIAGCLFLGMTTEHFYTILYAREHKQDVLVDFQRTSEELHIGSKKEYKKIPRNMYILFIIILIIYDFFFENGADSGFWYATAFFMTVLLIIYSLVKLFLMKVYKKFKK